MKLTLSRGCTAFGMEIDGDSLHDMSEARQNSILDITIQTLKKEQGVLVILEALIEQLGEWKSDNYICDQCGDTVEYWNLDLDN